MLGTDELDARWRDGLHVLAAHLAATVPPGAPDRVMYQVQRRARRRTFGRTATTAVALAAIIAFVVLLMPGTRNTPTLQIAPITAPPATQHTADACRRPVSTVHVIAEPTLHFDKTVYRAAAGCVQIVYSGAAGHTLAFDPPGPASPHLGSAWGEKGPRAFSWDLRPGSYTIYCAVPGHRAAGMQATLIVR